MSHPCVHPDHQEGQSCTDRAVACHRDCLCCLPDEWNHRPTNYEIEFDGDTLREHNEHEFNARFDDVRERFASELNLEAESWGPEE